MAIVVRNEPNMMLAGLAGAMGGASSVYNEEKRRREEIERQNAIAKAQQQQAAAAQVMKGFRQYIDAKVGLEEEAKAKLEEQQLFERNMQAKKDLIEFRNKSDYDQLVKENQLKQEASAFEYRLTEPQIKDYQDITNQINKIRSNETLNDEQKRQGIGVLEEKLAGIKPSKLPRRDPQPQDIVKQTHWMNPKTGHRYERQRDGMWKDLDANAEKDIAKCYADNYKALQGVMKTTTNSETGESSEARMYDDETADKMAWDRTKRIYGRFFPIPPSNQGTPPPQLVARPGVPTTGAAPVGDASFQQASQQVPVQGQMTPEAEKLAALDQQAQQYMGMVQKIQREGRDDRGTMDVAVRRLNEIKQEADPLRQVVTKQKIAQNVSQLPKDQQDQIGQVIQQIMAAMEQAKEKKDRATWLQLQQQLQQVLAQLAGSQQQQGGSQ